MIPANREQTGLLRILFFLVLLATFPFSKLELVSSTPEWLQCPTMFPQWINISLSAAQISIALTILKISLLTSALGLLTTISFWSALLSLGALMSNWYQYCYTTHELSPYPLAILIWALLDRDSGFRLQSLLKSKVSSYRSNTTTRWVLPFLKLHFCLVFMSAGISKILHGGLPWIQEPSLGNILILQNFLFEGAWLAPWFTPINHWVSGIPELCIILSVAVVLLETLAPLALVKIKFATPIVIGLALIQISIGVLVYINFVVWIPLYLVWLPLFGVTKIISKSLSWKKNAASSN